MNMIITIDQIENISGSGAGVFSKAAKAIGATSTLSYSYLMSTGVKSLFTIDRDSN